MRKPAIVRTVLGLAITAGLMSLTVSDARAQNTAQDDVAVDARVLNKCLIRTATLNFGDYDPVEANATAHLDVAGSIEIACTRGHSAWITLSPGDNHSGSSRRLKSGTGNFLNYDLYSTAPGGAVWPATGQGVSTGISEGKAWKALSVFARVPGAQDVAGGAYQDTVMATIQF